jgi:GMP synthase (glutamine-hydrolysing)
MPPIRPARPDVFGHPRVKSDIANDMAGDIAGSTPYRVPHPGEQTEAEARMTTSPQHETCLIVDFGSQVTQLIARRLRESGIYCEIHPFQKVDDALIDALAPKAVILSGGPCSVSDEGSPRANQRLFDLGVPVLGICYGQMVMVHQLGGHAEGGHHREFGRAFVKLNSHSELFEGIAGPGTEEQVWMSHGDRVTALPPGFQVQGASPNAPFAVLADPSRRFYGVMFHPEVYHTTHGAQLLRNFTHRIAGMSGDWTMAAYKDQSIAAIRDQVGDARVICGLSGGVDSSVAAVLIHEAIGDQLTCVFVDTGMMRANEAKEVVTLFRDHYNIPLIHADESALFLGELAGVTDPEVKRKTIGRLFIDVFDKHAKAVGGAEFLAQGTLYPDVIESVSFSGGPSVTIKSHHNVGGLPERMKMKLVEPLRELFKDEVRALGRELGLPESFVGRHPFPGPGLAIRCPGEITAEKLEILRKADTIYLDEIRKAGLYDTIWQAFAVLLPVRTVGVMGDGRTYDHVCALRAVTSVDGMTADYYPFPHDFLGRTASRIINEVKGINRVVYDVTSKPPGTIEWE